MTPAQMHEMRSSYAPWMYEGKTLFAALGPFRLRSSRWPHLAMKRLDVLTRTRRFSKNVQSFPSSPNTTFAAGETKNDQCSLAPGSWIWGLSGSTDSRTAGFKFQLANALTDRVIYEGEIAGATGAGAAGANVAPFFGAANPFLLDGLVCGFPYSAQMIVSITNLDVTAAALIQLCLFIAVPQWSILKPGEGITGAKV
jgi:hypothetical protein